MVPYINSLPPGHNDDVVKLYDLTDLCSEIVEDRSQNPFTVPVGMLLYRVARNMRHTCGRKKSGVIRTLLQNCLQLLDEDEFPQVWSHNSSFIF